MGVCGPPLICLCPLRRTTGWVVMMKRFKNILVVGSEGPSLPRLLAEAAALAGRNEADVMVLGVVESGRADRRVVLQDGSELDIERLLVDSLREELLDAVADQPDLDARVDVVSGRGFVEVIRAAVHDDHDLVMVGTDAPKRRLAGSSMAMHLLRKCPVPVWVENGNDDLGPDVAVAVGSLDEDGKHTALNRTLLELGSSLAVVRGGSLHVIHAWRLVGESLLRRGRARPVSEQIDMMVVATRDRAEESLQRLVRGIDRSGADVVVHFEHGEPENVVPSVIDGVRPGVVVMGTLARPGLRGVLMGNTAEHILSNTVSSVLAAKPPGFTTPIDV